MTTRKVAVSFPADLHARAYQAAEADGRSLSAWLAHAAERELQESAHVADGLAANAELEAEHGAITPSPEDRAWAADVLASATGEQRLAS
jgi:hypothetical protein